MCGGSGPKITKTDPEAERLKAEAAATKDANEKAAASARARKKQSLLASGASEGAPVETSSVLAYGKEKLGT